MTKDERFLIELYRESLKSSDPEAVIDPTQVAKRLGYKENLTKELLKGMRQANLVIIYGKNEVIVTDRGREVARSLLG